MLEVIYYVLRRIHIKKPLGLKLSIWDVQNKIVSCLLNKRKAHQTRFWSSNVTLLRFWSSNVTLLPRTTAAVCSAPTEGTLWVTWSSLRTPSAIKFQEATEKPLSFFPTLNFQSMLCFLYDTSFLQLVMQYNNLIQ